MRKPAIDWTPPEITKPRLYKTPVETYHCTLVTPLYGGGVTAGTVDEKMPIRVTTIRGQLRFWWRVAHKKNYLNADKKPDSQAMFKEERDIWGGLGDSDSLTASKVLVSVSEIKRQPTEACASYDKRPDGKTKTFPSWKPWVGGTVGGYALFPGQGKASAQGIEKDPAKLLKPGASWVLEVQYSDDCTADQQKEVNTALRWWASFGSVGGRGRRGLGAIQITELKNISRAEAEESSCKLILQQSNSHSDALKAWKEGLSALQQFRQGKGIGRNPGSEPNRPGRSRWPEPDAIRRMTRRNASVHSPEHSAGNLFPRAQFGLPIIFHFKDPGDPQDATLKPVGAERMASPLIIRPYFNSDDEQWYPAVLYIGLEPVALELGSGRTTSPVIAWPKTDSERQEAVNQIFSLSEVQKRLKPQKPLTPISAFLNYFKSPANFFNGN
jgi:CRISPR-associated protein Cmr1